MGAFKCQSSTHEFTKLLANGQAKASSAILARGGAVGLCERREELVLVRFGNSNARVGYGDQEADRCALHQSMGFELNGALVGELDGIGCKVGDDLANFSGVPHGLRRQARVHKKLKGDAFGARGENHGFARFDEGGSQIEGDVFELNFSRFDFGVIEHVVQNGKEGSAAVADDFGILAHFRLRGHFFDEPSHADDAIERRSDFVAHDGQEAAFGFVGILGAVPRDGEFASEFRLFNAEPNRTGQGFVEAAGCFEGGDQKEDGADAHAPLQRVRSVRDAADQGARDGGKGESGESSFES